MVIYKNSYCAEGLSDIERDVSECFDEDFNPIIKELPVSDGFIQGEFIMTIEWKPDSEDDDVCLQGR